MAFIDLRSATGRGRTINGHNGHLQHAKYMLLAGVGASLGVVAISALLLAVFS